MKSVSRTLHLRQKRQGREKRRPWGKLGLGFSLGVSLVLLPLIFGLLAGYASLTRALPSLESLPALLNPPDGSLLQPTRLYDRSGTHVILSLEEPAAAGREYLTIESLPQDLVDAYLAMFEPGFWESPGYTLEGIWEDTPQPLAHHPIAQRLVSELLLWEEPPSLRRNLRERLLAAQLIAQVGHAQVLEWSLNAAQFGPLIYGVDGAARVFFDKSAVDIKLAESTFLVAAAMSPEINALEVPQLVIERQKAVLEQMLLRKMITAAELADAHLAAQTLRDPIPPNNPAPAFTALVLEQISTRYPLERIQRGGLRVITSLDYSLQLQAICTTATHLARLQGNQVTEVTIDGQTCEAARLLPTLPRGNSTGTGGIAANVLVLEPASGQILAMTGEAVAGRDPAHLPGRPAGSLLTPFVYLAGFTRGLSPASLVWDLPPAQSNSSDSQSKLNPADYHGPLRLRTALANDYLEPAKQLVQQLGGDTILRLTQELGLDSLTSLPAGTESVFDQPVTLLDVAHTYSIFANQGTLAGQYPATEEASLSLSNGQPSIEPAAVIRLEDLHGNMWLDWSTAQKQAILASQLAYLMTDVLSDETARWPSLGHPNSLEIGRKAGAKLGVSSDGSSAWSLGFTPQRLTAIWMGYAPGSNQPASEKMVNAEMAAALWHALMQYATRGLASQGWEMPSGITSIMVCDPSGMLPTEICPNVVDEIFLTGSEPVQQDTLYQTFQVNRETGLLATVFTPAEMVEERVYLIVPPDAVEWAQQTGVPIPPRAYDAIYVPPPISEDVRIDAPGMFVHVGGEVEITGSASGDDFAYYRLQAGQGLNPQTWLQISDDIRTPVVDGVIGTWQTVELSGLYTIQLLVVRQDQSVEKALLQVTIDNQAPQVSLLNPLDRQSIRMQPGLKVLLQAEASDDLELSRLEFYIDQRLVATLVDPPYNVLWTAQLGQHSLTVIAYDLAGNTAQAMITFELVR